MKNKQNDEQLAANRLWWESKLKSLLVKEHAEYALLTDAEQQRTKAALIVGKVAGYIAFHHPFEKADVLALWDVFEFLADLGHGRKHPWAVPTNYGGTNRMLMSRESLRRWTVGVFYLLRENGFQPKEAYLHIAEGLTRSGRTSRGGKPFRWQLVQQWCRAAVASGEEPIGAVRLLWEDLSAFLTPSGRHLGSPPEIAKKALAFTVADYVWTMPEIRDRFISGGSEKT